MEFDVITMNIVKGKIVRYFNNPTSLHLDQLCSALFMLTEMKLYISSFMLNFISLGNSKNNVQETCITHSGNKILPDTLKGEQKKIKEDCHELWYTILNYMSIMMAKCSPQTCYIASFSNQS